MMEYLTTGSPASAQQLFSTYKVSDVLLTNDDFAKYRKPSFTGSNVIFKNGSYTILSLTENSGPIINRM
jgi:hypothetical protein